MGIGPAKVANDADTELYQVLVQRYLLTEKKGLHLRPPNFQTNVSDLFQIFVKTIFLFKIQLCEYKPGEWDR